MKKLFIIIFAAGLLLSTGIYVWQSGQRTYLEDKDVSADSFYRLLEEKDLFYVYFYSPTCSECLKAEPKIIEAVKKIKVNLYKLNISENREVYDTYKQQHNLPGVPVVLRFEQGQVTGGRAGSPNSADVYIQFFSETGGKK